MSRPVKPRRQPPKKRQPASPALIITTWIGAVLSLGLLLLTGSVVVGDFGSFRSCSGNDSLTVSSCGKQSINMGDMMLLLLFVLSASLFVSVLTAAWRMTRRTTAA